MTRTQCHYGSAEPTRTVDDGDTDTSTTSTPTRLNSESAPDGSEATLANRRRATIRERDSTYLWSSLVAGAGSGAVASVICAPLDLLRTRLQVWGDVHAKTGSGQMSIVRMIREMIAKEGYRGCFRGLGATLVTVPAFWGVYFPLYDETKRYWACRHPELNPALIHMGSAVLAGAVSDIICNPMFVVRTRLQTEALHQLDNHSNTGSRGAIKLSMIQTARGLYQDGGARIFWRGMSANLMGLSHVAVQFPVYEILKLKLAHTKKQPSAVDLLIASGLSKMTASLLTYPHEVIRSRMMDSRSASVRFTTTCRRIYAKEGMIGFYAGLPISLIRVIPNTCITFLTYEMFLRYAKDKIRKQRENERL